MDTTAASPAMNTLTTFLDSLTPDAAQYGPGLTILPLTTSLQPKVRYRPMSIALAKGLIEITEVDESGSVPDLIVTNTGNDPVLLLAGEEVAGAKQNRIFNTTILVDARSKLKVPVSCTEAGRWAFGAHKRFADSGHIAPATIRGAALKSVSQSLGAFRAPRADQRQVWDNVEKVAARHKSYSPTRALRDTMESTRSNSTETAKRLFPRVKGQIGFLAATASGVVTMETISRKSAYTLVHEKLIRSLLAENPRLDAPEVRLDGQIDQLLGALRKVKGQSFPSPGLGKDVRFEDARIHGSMLAHKGDVVHVSVYSD